MKVKGEHCQTIWIKPGDDTVVQIIDQRFLPHEFVIEDLRSVQDVVVAIRDMHVRGAPLIGVAAAYGMYLAVLEAARADAFDEYLLDFTQALKDARPTAINLAWGVERLQGAISEKSGIEEKKQAAFSTANAVLEEEVERCRQIGEHGAVILRQLANRAKGERINVLTHCNAGWLACIDYGTATAPIYNAFDNGMDVHVWVDETRPRNQGASLTAWELLEHGVPHTVIADNTGGHLMQHGMVDVVIVGTDRTTRSGDVVNKIGTYLKALAARDNNVPFYVALPSSTLDWSIEKGSDVAIEERDADEVRYIQGRHDGKTKSVLLTPERSPAANYAFDMTPARLVTGLITERGVCEASEESLSSMFPEFGGP